MARGRKKKHGLSSTLFYHVWSSMKIRCFRLKNKNFPRYGGRGITVCDKWLSFLNFRDDMYADYLKHKAIHKTTTIDRINNDGNYCKRNCKWSTPKEQSNNARTNIPVSVNGVKISFNELS